MAMLAERKQKQRWSLNPRGKLWSEDSNKFGQKMLEKMGWKHGKGLGANEDGNTDHVKVSYKNDSKGMGFKDNTEQWTEHDDKFNGLLKALNGDSNDADNNLKLNSLHEIAETTKTRINYHKFTKGKDLSRYSEKDLANIFGKKSLTAKTEPQELIVEKKPSVIVESENLVERGSMTDYFKKKLPNFGRNLYGLKIGSNGVLTKDSDSESERPAFGFGFKSENAVDKPKGKKRKYEDCFSMEDAPKFESERTEEELPKSGKKKKSKKISETFVSYLNGVGNSDEPVKLEEKEIADEAVGKKKKKKKSKIISEEAVEIEESPIKIDKTKTMQVEEEIGDIEDIVVAPPSEENKKKSKKQQNKTIQEITVAEPSSVEDKKKSKKQQNKEIIQEMTEDTFAPPSERNETKSKKRQNKEAIQEMIEDAVVAPSSEENEKKSKKRQNKKTIQETIEFTVAAPSSEEDKKKCKRIQNTESIDEMTEVVAPSSKGKSKKKQENEANEVKIDETTPKPKKKKSKKFKDEPRGGVSNAAFDPTFKSPPKIEKTTVKGIANPAFDPLYSHVIMEKHNLNAIQEISEENVEEEKKIREEIVGEPPVERKKKRKKNKKGNKELQTEVVEGLSNPGFDPLYNEDEDNIIQEKHQFEAKIKEKKYRKEEIEAAKPEVAIEDMIVEPESKKRKKTKKNRDETKQETAGISNPCFNDNLNDSKPSEPQEIECDLMLNVFSAPPQPKRRKSVRFSDVNEERIILNNAMRERNELFDINTEIIQQGIENDKINGNTAEQGFLNNGFDIRSIDDASFYDETPNISVEGTDNAAFDRRAANLEEKVKNMSKTIENCEAEVDNDINERRSAGASLNTHNHGYSSNHWSANSNYNRRRPIMKPYRQLGNDQLTVTVGERDYFADKAEPVEGGVRLSFRQANLSRKVQPWMKRPGMNIAKQGYKHLIKGDIIVNFQSTNFHEIKGYAVQSEG